MIEQSFTQFADGPGTNSGKNRRVIGGQDQTRDIVVVRVEHWVIEDFTQRDIGERPFGGDSFSFRTSADSGQLVSRLLLVGPSEQITKIGKRKCLTAKGCRVAHTG